MFEINRSLAIIIGIDKYQHIRPLKNAVADAVGLAEVLKDIYGYFSNIFMVTRFCCY
ncbi:MAG: caspase family protein [Pleurocapsa sp. MO_226.B13]|nr:caspase family protein [Pleurocapsa sp. MO_226.B13]